MIPLPNIKNIARVGGADLQLHPGMADKYRPRHKIGDWKAEWFYIDNHAPSLLDRIPSPPKQCAEWFAHGQNKEQENELLQWIVALRSNGVTGMTVILSWLRKQIQPLQKRCNFHFEYTGMLDPSRFSLEKIYEEAMVLVHSVLEGVSAAPEIPPLHHFGNPLNQLTIRSIK